MFKKEFKDSTEHILLLTTPTKTTLACPLVRETLPHFSVDFG